MDTIGISQTDFLSGGISMTFDLEKARDAAKFDDRMAITMFPLAIAEIERLRAEISEQKGMIWKTQQVKKEQAARIAELEADLEQSEICIRARMDVIDQQAAQIKSLGDALVEELAADIAYDDRLLWSRLSEQRQEKYREKARQQLQAGGKIGPDARPPCWQITEERKAALAAMSNLSETISCPDCGVWIGFADIGPHMAVLRGMLEESQ